MHHEDKEYLNFKTSSYSLPLILSLSSLLLYLFARWRPLISQRYDEAWEHYQKAVEVIVEFDLNVDPVIYTVIVCTLPSRAILSLPSPLFSPLPLPPLLSAPFVPLTRTSQDCSAPPQTGGHPHGDQPPLPSSRETTLKRLAISFESRGGREEEGHMERKRRRPEGAERERTNGLIICREDTTFE